MIRFRSKGNFKQTESRLKKLLHLDFESALHKYGEMGVQALSAATPKDTGKSAESWGYKIVKWKDGNYSLFWTNSNAPYGIPVVFLIQYGHGTKNGGYVQPNDFINPALKPVFDKIMKHIEGEMRTR